MELGRYALINAPCLWALVPLVVYIFLVFKGIKPITAIIIGTIIGLVLLGIGPAQYANALGEALGSFLGVVGVIIMFGSGLGVVMVETGVSQTLVSWIIKVIGVDTENKAIVVVTIASILICGLLGTLAGGLSIIAPILIPVVAAVGLTPSTVGVIFQTAGETGLIWGPFTPPVVALLGVTGLTYGRMMLYAALPFGIVWLVVLYIMAKRTQKATKGIEKYEDLGEENIKEFIPTKEEKRATIVFGMVFIICIGYGLVTKQGTNYIILIMPVLAAVTGLTAKKTSTEILSSFTKGMGKMAEMYFMFILLEPFINLVVIGGGFDAVANILMKFLKSGSKMLLMLVGTFVGAFGIDGAAVAQIKITHELFAPAVEAMKLPMEMWAIGLIAASRITANIYPTGNMVSCMGIARSKNLKYMLYTGWAVSLSAIGYIALWSAVGEKLFLHL